MDRMDGMEIFRSRLRDRCKTLAADRQWFLVRDSYIPCELASLARVPFAERRGGPPLSFGHFPRRAGATLPP